MRHIRWSSGQKQTLKNEETQPTHVAGSFPLLLGAGPEAHPKHRSQGHAESPQSLPAKLVKAEVLVTQSCPTLCDPTMDCSLPGSSVRGILQARTLEWVAISFSNA